MTPEEAIERADEIDTETRYRHQLQREAFQAGRQSVLSNPVAAFNLAHDHGYGARQDYRGFVKAIVEGFEQGSQARKEIAQQASKGLTEKEAEAS